MSWKTDVRLTLLLLCPVTHRRCVPADEHVLKALLERLTGEPELPILLIGGKVVGTMPEIRYMYTKGDLARKIKEAGAIIDGIKKKKGRKH